VVISIHRTFRLAAGRLAEDLRNKKRRHLNGFTGLLPLCSGGLMLD
jgi:hypothetical protein